MASGGDVSAVGVDFFRLVGVSLFACFHGEDLCGSRRRTFRGFQIAGRVHLIDHGTDCERRATEAGVDVARGVRVNDAGGSECQNGAAGESVVYQHPWILSRVGVCRHKLKVSLVPEL